MGRSALVPHRFVGLADGSVGGEYEVAVELTREPSVMGHGYDASLECRHACLECFRTREVEVVRRLIEKKHCGTG